MNAPSRSAALDILKGLAILAVIAQHTIPGETLRELGRNAWIRPAVPVFFVILGMNLVRSRDGATWTGVLRRLDRILVPFVLIALVCYAAAAVRGDLELQPSYVLGALPLEPPGNYFVTALVGIVVVGPLLLAAFHRRPLLTVIACVAINIVVEVVLLQSLGVADDLREGRPPYWFPAFPLRFFAAVAIGMWLADPRLRDRRAVPLLALAVPSLAFLIALDAGAEPLGWFPDSFEKAMSVFAVPWAALLVLVGLRWLPARTSRPGPAALLAVFGRASYHIYLAQMAWIAIVTDDVKDSGDAPLHFAVSLLLGLLLYRMLPGGLLRGRRPGGDSRETGPAARAGSGSRAAAATDPPAD